MAHGLGAEAAVPGKCLSAALRLSLYFVFWVLNIYFFLGRWRCVSVSGRERECLFSRRGVDTIDDSTERERAMQGEPWTAEHNRAVAASVTSFFFLVSTDDLLFLRHGRFEQVDEDIDPDCGNGKRQH